MLTKQAFALLALGAELRADRTYPHPHHYTVQLSGLHPVELTTDDVIELLKGSGPHPAKLPDGHPRKRIWLAKLRDRAREAGQDPEVSAKRSASLRRQWAEGKRHPRYQSPELTFGGQA